jgi:hypothetical protein
MAEWRFRIPQDSEMNMNPIAGEFFTTHDIENFGEALVRECIQNSLDAKDPALSDPVHIRFYFSGDTEAADLRLNSRDDSFFKNLYKHVVLAKKNGIDKTRLPDLNGKTNFLLIEDFRTTGLNGDKERNSDHDEGVSGQNFYWFWRNVGRSGKNQSERGKWGLGKTVFPASSMVNTFFGLTKRSDREESLLMGLCVLKTHYLNDDPNTKRYPYGYFAEYIRENDMYFATPLMDKTSLDSFINTFKLNNPIFQLKREKENGLSVVIPFPRKEITPDSVMQSVLKQYFHPILSGNLVVDVVYDEDDKNVSVNIDRQSVGELLTNINYLRHKKKAFELCKYAIQMDENRYISLQKSRNIENHWDQKVLSPEIKNQLGEHMLAFEKGEKPLSFKVPVRIGVNVSDINGIRIEEKSSHFKVILERDDTLSNPDVYFIRDGITITGESKRVRNRKARALVLVEEKHLSTLLGLSENPAHTEWQKNSSHFLGMYSNGESVISFVVNSVDKLFDFLKIPSEGVDKESMKDMFYFETPLMEEKRKKGEGVEIAPPKNNPQPLRIEKTNDGFRACRNNEFGPFSGKIKIQVAYMLDSGNPIKRYNKRDFDLSVLNVQSSDNVYVEEIVLNSIVFSVVAEDDFYLQLGGFDIKRDLFIKSQVL